MDMPSTVFQVLGKVVPRSDSTDFDPVTRRLRREGVPQFLSPLDQRALRVALDLRKAGDTVHLLSVGVPTTAPILAESYALGVDTIELVSDPAFAGSDTLATARILDRAIADADGTSRIVLTGERSTDSETGQVPAELAELRGWPLFASARRIRRIGDAPGFEITTETDRGWIRWRAAPPFVVSVGEKIAPLTKASPEEIERARGRPIPRLDNARLQIPVGSVGAAGSPTDVRWLRHDATPRSHRVFSEGSLSERIDAALETLRDRLARPPPEALPRSPSVSSADRTPLPVLVTDEEGRLDEEALTLLGGARAALPKMPLRAVWVGDPPRPTEAVRLASVGATVGDCWPVPSAPWETGGVAEALTELFTTTPTPLGGLFVAHEYGRAVAGRSAARIGAGLTGEAVGVVEEGEELVWVKPAWGGMATAGIGCRSRPSLATVRPGVWGEEPPGGSPTKPLRFQEHPPIRPERRIVVEAKGRLFASEAAALRRAPMVVVIGRGFGGRGRIREIAPLLERWGASWGATRKVVDAEGLPRWRQIGLTGVSLAPRMAILLGVGGSPNHLIGLRRAGTLLAINSDPAAPVFGSVDVGIVARWEEALPYLAEALGPWIPAPRARASPGEGGFQGPGKSGEFNGVGPSGA